MKYTNEDRGWKPTAPPLNTEIWACAYSTNNTEKSMALRKKPVKGIIKQDGFYDYFFEYKKDGKTLKKSGAIKHTGRQYADTYEECVELYNTLVDKQITVLQELFDKCMDDYI